MSRLGVLPLLPGASVRFAQCQDVHRYTLLELNKGSIEILGRSPLKLQSTSRCFFFICVSIWFRHKWLEVAWFGGWHRSAIVVFFQSSESCCVTTLGRAIWDSCVGTFIHWPTCSSRTKMCEQLFLCHFRSTCVCRWPYLAGLVEAKSVWSSNKGLAFCALLVEVSILMWTSQQPKS